MEKLNNNLLQPGAIGARNIEKLDGLKGQKPPSLNENAVQGPAFDKHLQEKLAAPELKFSAHAKARLSSRGIELSPDEIVKMQEAVQKMGQKGAKESLILTDKAAFVVSVKNNTVITAVDKDSMKENVFTNIDSTVMI